MKTEAQYCSVLTKSLMETGNFGWKIPDPSSEFSKASLRLFDILGILNKQPLYLEAKFSSKPQAFNLKRIEQHQAYYLDLFSKLDNTVCLICFGVQWKRGDIRSYVFDWRSLRKRFYSDEFFSIHKKELELMPYNKISKGICKFDNIVRDEIFETLNKIRGHQYDKNVYMPKVQETEKSKY